MVAYGDASRKAVSHRALVVGAPANGLILVSRPASQTTGAPGGWIKMTAIKAGTLKVAALLLRTLP
jgi:hypothetical protein